MEGSAQENERSVVAPGARLTKLDAASRFDSLARKTLAADQGSDGMTLDDEGNIYLTGEGVMVYNEEGRQIDRIRVSDERWTANVSFVGSDRRTLFITASNRPLCDQDAREGCQRGKVTGTDRGHPREHSK